MTDKDPTDAKKIVSGSVKEALGKLTGDQRVEKEGADEMAEARRETGADRQKAPPRP